MSQQVNIHCTPAQTAILTSDAPEVYMIGGLGAGKSHSVAHVAWNESCKYRNNYGAIAMTTGPQLERSIIYDTHRWFRHVGIRFNYNESKRLVIFPHGSSYFYQTLEIPWQELKGPTLGWVCVDEIDTCTLDRWNMLCARVRKPGTGRIIRGFGNPVPTGHWLMDRYREYITNPSGPVRFIIVSTYDNPFLPKDYCQRLERMYPPGTLQHRRWMLGEMGIAMEGAVYPEFSISEHCISEAEQPKFARTQDGREEYLYGIDFGFNNPFCFLRAGYTADDVLVVNGEYYASRELLSVHAEAIRSLYRGGDIVADHDAQDREELAHHGISTYAAPKDITAGIEAVRARLRDGRLKIVASACPNLVRELSSYCWAEPTKSADARELPLKKDDHCCDALRYMVLWLDMPRPPQIDWGSVLADDGPRFRHAWQS